MISLLVHVSDPARRSSRNSNPATIAIRTDGAETSAEVVDLPDQPARAGFLPEHQPSKRAHHAKRRLRPGPLPRGVQKALDDAKQGARSIDEDEPLFVNVIDVTEESTQRTMQVRGKPLQRSFHDEVNSRQAHGFDVYSRIAMSPPPRKGAVVSAVA